MTVTTWSPVSDLATVEVEIDRLQGMFDAAFSGTGHAGWIPSVDIFETAGKDVVVKVDLPGLTRDAIKVTFENQVLTIAGERKPDIDKPQGFHRIERGVGAFRRSFSLPATLDAGRVEATFADGVLTITLPRREEAKARQIPIRV